MDICFYCTPDKIQISITKSVTIFSILKNICLTLKDQTDFIFHEVNSNDTALSVAYRVMVYI